jgi:dihydroceramidase
MAGLGYFVVFSALPGLLCIYLLNRFYITKNIQPLRRNESSARLYHDLTTCMNILECIAVDNLMDPNQLSPVRARAIPNQRLARAFGMDNAFTTTLDDYWKEFRTLAARKLAVVKDDEWKYIAKTAKQVVHDKTQVSGRAGRTIPIVPLIQLLSLKISLHVIFQTDPLASNDEVVSSLARTINELWIQSKGSFPNEEGTESLQANLRKDLNSLFPTQSFNPRTTPMNLIIPIYETLWRVVLQCFIEVAFRHPSSASFWRFVLAEYARSPTKAQFTYRYSSSPGDSADVSAEFLAKEALRLYPPTRRIYRTFRLSSEPTHVTVAADVERLHRDSEHWGADSEMYVPGRWASASKEARKAYIPFGGRLMECPAKPVFGPRIIAVLLAVLVEELGTGEWELGDERDEDTGGEGEVGTWEWENKEWEHQGGDERHHDQGGSLSDGLNRVTDPSQPLESSRESHASLYLRRK